MAEPEPDNGLVVAVSLPSFQFKACFPKAPFMASAPLPCFRNQRSVPASHARGLDEERKEAGADNPRPRAAPLRQLRRLWPEGQFVLQTESGDPGTESGFRKTLARIGEAAGFPWRVHPHQLRHASPMMASIPAPSWPISATPPSRTRCATPSSPLTGLPGGGRIEPSSDAILPSLRGIMIKFELLKDAGVLVVQPQSALSADDFGEVARAWSIPTSASVAS